MKEYLGSDVWEHVDSVLNSQTGLNLRNDVAHGLARLHHCSPENVGLTLSLLYFDSRCGRPLGDGASELDVTEPAGGRGNA